MPKGNGLPLDAPRGGGRRGSRVAGYQLSLPWQGPQWVAWSEGPGIAYMLRGDKGASNADPFATGPTATNEWVVSPPHVMVLYTDPKLLDAYPTDPKNGGPWVMWKGTPYAHLMVPVAPKHVATMGAGK